MNQEKLLEILLAEGQVIIRNNNEMLEFLEELNKLHIQEDNEKWGGGHSA